MPQTHLCPYCRSSNTVITLSEPTRQYYLCRDCRAAHGVAIRPDVSDDASDTPTRESLATRDRAAERCGPD